jgi:hypothetical protein
LIVMLPGGWFGLRAIRKRRNERGYLLILYILLYFYIRICINTKGISGEAEEKGNERNR